MPLFLGLDAGNSKTVAIVCDERGTVVGRGRSGPGDIYLPSGSAVAVESWRSAITDAVTEAGTSLDRIVHAGLNMAGADWEDDCRFIADHARMTLGLTNFTLHNDAVGPLHAEAPESNAVSVIAGTFTAIGGRSRDGRVWHGCWWLECEPLMSAGELAFRAALKEAMGLRPSSALAHAVPAAYGEPTLESLLHRFNTRGATTRPDFSRLNRVVQDVAATDDAGARQVIDDYAATVSRLAKAVAGKLNFETNTVVALIGGGSFRHSSPLLANALYARLSELMPGIRLQRMSLEPVCAAALFALEAQGGEGRAERRERLRETLGDLSFLAT
ncbi:N-acetylglucosamine kinase [Nibricoccus sp. IMCC34717]|uniref:N-acetylglucosamine kinase n=1 Tax=Nibricoccus sp. IMCC34717 TaxID=3034021 RepID=UPI003850F3D4